MMSFGNSSFFAGLPALEYQPFKPLNEVRELFDHKVNICLAVGGWGDNAGFNAGVQTDLSIASFAKNVATTLDRFGFDCVGEYLLDGVTIIWLTHLYRHRLGVSWR
jgi:hypothetical protein